MSPRVLHIGKFFPPVAGGIEIFLADLLAAAGRAGIEMGALVHQPAGKGPDLPDSWHGCPLYGARSYGELLYAPLSPGFPIVLARAIRRFRPDLLHIHMPNTSAFCALAVPAARRLPWVVHWQADAAGATHDRRLALAYRAYRPIEQALLRRSTRIVATTPPYLETSPALARWRERCEVIPLGIDPGRLDKASGVIREWASRQWPADGLRILAVSRLAYYKGFEVLLRALARVEGCQLLLVGEGPRRAALEGLPRELGLERRVRLAGPMSILEPELQGIMAAADVVCVPSLERAESFGIVLLEAMHFACPVIASDIPGSGVGWVVRQGGHGLLVPPGDVDALSGALERMRDDPELRSRLGATGAERLRELFHIDLVLEQWMGVYRGVLAHK